jgi:hypothetical protein
LRINLYLDSGAFQLSHHFIEIAYSQVQHPHLAGVPEIVCRLRKGPKTVGPASCSQTGCPWLVGARVIPRCCWYQRPNPSGSLARKNKPPIPVSFSISVPPETYEYLK